MQRRLFLGAHAHAVPAQEVAALEEVAASAGDDAEMRSLAEEARH